MDSKVYKQAYGIFKDGKMRFRYGTEGVRKDVEVSKIFVNVRKGDKYLDVFTGTDVENVVFSMLLKDGAENHFSLSFGDKCLRRVLVGGVNDRGVEVSEEFRGVDNLAIEYSGRGVHLVMLAKVFNSTYFEKHDIGFGTDFTVTIFD